MELPFSKEIKRLFSSEPVFPLTNREIKKINIEWLAKQVPESMLIEMEKEELQREERLVEDLFIPNGKVAIYNLISNNIATEDGRDRTKRVMKLDFFDKKMNKNTIVYAGYFFGFLNLEHRFWDIFEVYEVVNYSLFLDKIFGTNLTNKICCELEEYCKRIINKENLFTSSSRETYMEVGRNYRSLVENYYKEFNDFMTREKQRRKFFYESNNFRNDIKRENESQEKNNRDEEEQKYENNNIRDERH